MKRNIDFPRMSSLVEPEVLNPFVHRLKLSTLDKIKIAVMSVTIAPLRLLLVLLLLILVWPLAVLGTSWRSKQDDDKPMTGWRWKISTVIRFMLRGAYFVFGFHCVKLKGTKVKAEEAPLLCVAPHSSFFDTCVMTVGSQMGTGVSRAENAKAWFFGRIIKYTQPVLVQREDANSRSNTIEEIKRRCKSGGEWPQIFIFPEGTCSNKTCLISFKGGAFYPGAPVQPVLLRYKNSVDTTTWTWDGPGAFTCLWLTLCQFQNHLEIEYLPVYTPNAAEIADSKLFANNVRQYMADALGVPVTDHTYDDCRLMKQARKMRLPMEAGLVEFGKLHKKLGLSFDSMQELLNKFKLMKPAKDGQVTLDEFASYLRLPVSPALKEVFALYDRDGNGTVDFREYVIGLSLVSNPANNQETLRYAFQAWDSEDKGYITQTELQTILGKAFAMDPRQSAQLFDDVDTDTDGKITFEDFKDYAKEKPEYAKLFVTYQDMNQDDPPSPSPSPSNGHALINRATTSANNSSDGQAGTSAGAGAQSSNGLPNYVDGKLKMKKKQ